MFALSLVHERGELKLLRRHILGERGDKVLDAALMCCEHLKLIANKEQIFSNGGKIASGRRCWPLIRDGN
jgi:hypothetical protein